MNELLWQKPATIIISLAIFAFTCFVRQVTKSWTHPAVLFGLFWFFMTFIPLIAVIDVPIRPGGVVFIGATVVAFALPAIAMRHRWPLAIAVAHSRKSHDSHGNSLLMGACFFSMQAMTLSFVLANLHLQGFTISEFAVNPITAANRYLRARYDGLVSANVFSQAGIVLNYVAVALGGLLVARIRALALQAVILFAAFFPSLVYMQVYADKGTLFLAAAYFFGALIVSRVSAGDTRLITRNTVLALVASMAILVPALILTMAARDGSPNGPSDAMGKIMFYLRSYAFGHVYAFSDWFNHFVFGNSLIEYTDPDQQTWGYWTAMAIGEIVWPSYDLPDGYFTEYFSHPGILQTNVYTMFRGAIYDFGLIGTLVAMGLAGWAGSVVYLQMLRFRAPAFSQSFFIFLVGFLYTSFIFSLLTWTSVYAAAVIVTVILIVDRTTAKPWPKVTGRNPSNDSP